MSAPPEPSPPGRARREPPRFRPATVRAVERLTPRLVRVTLAGPELVGMPEPDPAASARLLLPEAGRADVVMPRWDGNQFLLPDGRRPTIRTFTPRRVDPAGGEIDLMIVVHGSGAASDWAATAAPGAAVAIAGFGRGYRVDPDATGFLLAGDETALAAIAQLLEALPEPGPVRVHVEIGEGDARLSLPHPRAEVAWHVVPDGVRPGDALADAVRGADVSAGTRVWAAGEAAAMQGIRHHLFAERGVARSDASVRGYWKHGRSGDPDG